MKATKDRRRRKKFSRLEGRDLDEDPDVFTRSDQKRAMKQAKAPNIAWAEEPALELSQHDVYVIKPPSPALANYAAGSGQPRSAWPMVLFVVACVTCLLLGLPVGAAATSNGSLLQHMAESMGLITGTAPGRGKALLTRVHGVHANVQNGVTQLILFSRRLLGWLL